MSILDMTPREMAHALRLWPGRKLRRLSYRVRRALTQPGPVPPPGRKVRSRFIGLGRHGEDVWLDTGMPGSMTFPVMVGGSTASFIAADQDIPLFPSRPTFSARVFCLHRITRADHLGPTEAEYREVRDAQ